MPTFNPIGYVQDRKPLVNRTGDIGQILNYIREQERREYQNNAQQINRDAWAAQNSGAVEATNPLDTIFPVSTALSTAAEKAATYFTGSENAGMVAGMLSPTSFGKNTAGRLGIKQYPDATAQAGLPTDTVQSGIFGTKINPPMQEHDAIGALMSGVPVPNNIRVSGTLNKAIDAFTSGKLGQDGFVQKMTDLHDATVLARTAKKMNPPELQRGLTHLNAVMANEINKGRLQPEAADIISWVAGKNPALAQNLNLSFDKSKISSATAAGMYDQVPQQVVVRALNLLQLGNKDNILTLPHEFLHHTERFLPVELRDGIHDMWWNNATKRLVKAAKENDTDMINYLKAATSGNTDEALKAFDVLNKAGRAQGVYQHASPSEFWAENGSRVMRDRAVGSLGEKAKSYYNEFAEKVKGTFGLDNADPAYKAIRSLSTAKTEYPGNVSIDASSAVGGKTVYRKKVVSPKPGMTHGETLAAGAGLFGATALGAAGADLIEQRQRERELMAQRLQDERATK